jgi:hypothetical protein
LAFRRLLGNLLDASITLVIKLRILEYIPGEAVKKASLAMALTQMRICQDS